MRPLRDAGPLTGEYSLVSDWHDRWLPGGLEPDVIAEAHLDEASVIAGVVRFAEERGERLRGGNPARIGRATAGCHARPTLSGASRDGPRPTGGNPAECDEVRARGKALVGRHQPARGRRCGEVVSVRHGPAGRCECGGDRE